MKISVVIPAYNAEETIAETLDSVLKQTVLAKLKAEKGKLKAEVELIVVDDCSTDGTVVVVEDMFKSLKAKIDSAFSFQLLDTFAVTCSAFRLVRMDENSGPAAARNRGIQEAKGEWIAFLDADDAWLPWALELHIETLEFFPDAVLFSGQVSMNWDAPHERPKFNIEACRHVKLIDFVDENPLGTSAVFARKDSLVNVGGFDERFRGPEDIDLWMRLTATGIAVVTDCIVTRYRERPGSLCMTSETFLPEILRVYNKAYALGGALYGYRRYRKRTVAMRYVSAAWADAMSGNRLSGVCMLLRSWLSWPWLLKPEIKQPLWRFVLLFKIMFNISNDS